jgi:hypothetical protein
MGSDGSPRSPPSVQTPERVPIPRLVGVRLRTAGPQEARSPGANHGLVPGLESFDGVASPSDSQSGQRCERFLACCLKPRPNPRHPETPPLERQWIELRLSAVRCRRHETRFRACNRQSAPPKTPNISQSPDLSCACPIGRIVTDCETFARGSYALFFESWGPPPLSLRRRSVSWCRKFKKRINYISGAFSH